MTHTVVQGDSPEAVALRLLEYIAFKEGRKLGEAGAPVPKTWFLATYKECLDVVSGRSPVKPIEQPKPAAEISTHGIKSSGAMNAEPRPQYRPVS